MPITRTMLSSPQRFALANWLAANKDQLAGRNREAYAKAATIALGFEVTKANIDGAAEMAGLKLEGVRKHKGGEQTDRVRILARVLSDFIVSCGCIPDSRLKPIIDGKRVAK